MLWMLQPHAQEEHFIPSGKDTDIQEVKSESAQKFVFRGLSIRHNLGQGQGADLAPIICVYKTSGKLGEN